MNVLRTRTLGKKITIQNDMCVTGNKKDQPVQKHNLIRTINIKNDTSTAAKEKNTNSDSTSGNENYRYVYMGSKHFSLGIIVSSQNKSPRNPAMPSSRPKPEKLPVELPVLNPDLIKKSHLKQDQETSGMDFKEH